MAKKTQSGITQPIVAKILNGLSDLDDIRCRPMFGCFGLYQSDVFFGIICGDGLFFRTDEESRKKYIKRGMEYLEFRENQKEKNYYKVPPAVVRSPSELCRWAAESIETQRQRRETSAKKTRRR